MSIKDELGVTKEKETYDTLKEKFDNAEKSDRPFTRIQENDKIEVVGNPNNTKTDYHNFKAVFNIPKEIADQESITGDIVGDKVVITKVYENVIIDAQSTAGITGALATLVPYFYKPLDDGTLGEFNAKEILVMIQSMRYPDFTDAMYKICQNALKISDDLIRHLDALSAVEIMSKIMDEYPDVVNAAYNFFTSNGQQNVEE